MDNRMSIEELYDYLCSPQFLDEKSGNIFYNYYIYQYPACDEYDLFTVFCDYLRKEKFGDTSLLEDTLEGDKVHPDLVTEELTAEANSDSFVSYVRDRILEHMEQNDGLKKPYVFIHGIGKMFPYLRTNVFLTRYEKYNDPSSYRIILFYPGHQDGNSFSLFDTLEDAHTYRAILLINK